jgi:protein-L-isoaspartate O-methyltransferase
VNLLSEEKLFYERFYALHRDPQMLNVFKAIGIEAFRRSSVLEGFAEFLKQQGVFGRRCVEIGTCNGLTAIVLARHFEEVVTIDIAPNSMKHRIAVLCEARNIRFIDVESNTEKARLIAGLDFDFAYVDGDHAHDTEADFALVKRSGRVLFHEYWDAQPAVVSLVNRLKAAGNVVTKGKLALWTA